MSLNIDKKEFGSPVITGVIWSEVNNMARSSYARFSIQEFYVFGMKTFLLIAHVEKEKKTWRVALNSKAHIEEIGELEGKKSLSKDVLVFFKGGLESDHLQKTTRAIVFRLDFQVLFRSL